MLVEGQRAIEETITSKLEGSLPSLQEDGGGRSELVIDSRVEFVGPLSSRCVPPGQAVSTS